MVAFAFACEHQVIPNRDQILPTFEIEEGFDLDLVAAEPLLSDPVDMEIDEFGRVYIVEMHGYPLDVGGSGIIRQLKDIDKDGRFDQSSVFADGLILPTGIMRWKNGFVITDAPDILYLEDTDNDDKADIKEVILTGFALSNPQHNVNNPIYGIDNWIYLSKFRIVLYKYFVQFKSSICYLQHSLTF